MPQRYERSSIACASIEADRGLGNTSSPRRSRATTSSCMAYKDEYEVARLYTRPSSAAAREAFEGDYTLKFHLAPPLFAKPDPVTGVPRKRTFGAWMMSAFRLLAKLKGLRGTAFDVFGRTEERRTERELIADYERTVEELLATLGPRQPRDRRRDREHPRRDPRVRPREGREPRAGESEGSGDCSRRSVARARQAGRREDPAQRGLPRASRGRTAAASRGRSRPSPRTRTTSRSTGRSSRPRIERDSPFSKFPGLDRAVHAGLRQRAHPAGAKHPGPCRLRAADRPPARAIRVPRRLGRRLRARRRSVEVLNVMTRRGRAAARVEVREVVGPALVRKLAGETLIVYAADGLDRLRHLGQGRRSRPTTRSWSTRPDMTEIALAAAGGTPSARAVLIRLDRT